MLFTQLFINGLQTGALYALIAAGFSLIFGMGQPLRLPVIFFMSVIQSYT